MGDYKQTPNDLAAVIGDLRRRLETLERNPPIVKLETAQVRLVLGNVNSDGTIAGGTGFSVAHVAASGLYTLTFSPAFTDVPYILPVTITAADRTASIDSGATVDETTARVFIVDTSAGTLADSAFFFAAFGAA